MFDILWRVLYTRYFWLAILTLAALGSAGRSLAETITWTGAATNSFDISANQTLATAENPCNGETVTATFSDPDSAASGAFPGVAFGTIPYMAMNAAAPNETVQLDLLFGGGLPVENLSFLIYDVDRSNDSGSSWNDVLTVTAAFGPTATAVSLACNDGDGICSFTITGSGTTNAIATSGTNNPVFTSANGQVVVTIPGPVDSVSIENLAGGPGTNFQVIGFGDLDFDCSTVPVTVAAFESSLDAKALSATWTTSSETSNLGFELWGESEGEWQALDMPIVPSAAVDSLVPQSYHTQISALRLDRLMLAEIDTRGRRRMHGPFELGKSYGGAVTNRAIDWDAIRRELERGSKRGVARPAIDPGTEPAAAELRVEETGIYRVTYEQLASVGLDLAGVDPTSIALTERGLGVPRRVITGTRASFGPGGSVEFLGQALDTLFTRTNVYRLSVNRSRVLAATEREVSPGATAAEAYTETRWIAPQNQYSFGTPSSDPWFADRLLAFTTPVSRDYPLAVDHLTAGKAELVVELWGVTNLDEFAPDHHVEIALNGTALGELIFNGLQSQHLAVEIPDGLLSEGDNTLTLTLPADTGAPFDLVHLEGYGATYPRRFIATGDRLSFTDNAIDFAVDGLGSSKVVAYSWDGNVLHHLGPIKVEPTALGNAARFRGIRSRGQTYWVSTVESLQVPSVSLAQPAAADLLSGEAEYLVISHPSFIDGLAPLLEARQRDGYSVKVVDVEDLYRQYTGGVFDPEAIRSYLREAASRLGTRMVLLVGGDSYDYLDHLALGSVSFLPTLYARVHPVVSFAPADSLLADLDGDGLQDLAIGRLPVRTAAELDQVISKTLAYGMAAPAAVVAADRHDGRTSFRTASEQIADTLPSYFEITRAYVDDLGAVAAHDTLLAALEDGVPIVSYTGHSGPAAWSFDNLLTTTDADGLGNFTSPTAVFAWGCWNAYHSVPQYDTLSHRLLLAPAGAAALVGAATLTSADSDRALAVEVFRQAFSGDEEAGLALGEALVRAKHALAQEGHGDDVLVGVTLLGDPALRLEN